MGEWAMPAHAMKRFEGVREFLTGAGKWEEAKPFVRGGYWDNFLTKYPESNYMHKRMLYVSKKISNFKSGSEPEPEILNLRSEIVGGATRALYRAQCNCAYWHGLFGGLYLNYLRHAVYKNLIEAENIIDDRSRLSGPGVRGSTADDRITMIDIDCDRNDEFILRNDGITAVVKPDRGAGLVELSHIKSGLNLQDVVARREEAYHTKNENRQKMEAARGGIPSIHDLNKDPSTAGKIVYDVCERFSFLERIWPANASGSNIYKDVIYVCKSPYELLSQTTDSVTFTADAAGRHLTKTYRIGKSPGLKVQFNLKFKTPVENEFRFGTELNLTLLAGHDKKRYYLFGGSERKFMDAAGCVEQAAGLKLVDEYFGIGLDIRPDRKMDIWYFPVNTVSQSETGFDLLYQGSCIIWSALVPKGSREFNFAIDLEFS
jgi:alpha-amylase